MYFFPFSFPNTSATLLLSYSETARNEQTRYMETLTRSILPSFKTSSYIRWSGLICFSVVGCFIFLYVLSVKLSSYQASPIFFKEIPLFEIFLDPKRNLAKGTSDVYLEGAVVVQSSDYLSEIPDDKEVSGYESSESNNGGSNVSVKQEFWMSVPMDSETGHGNTAEVALNLTMQRMTQLINERKSWAGNHLARVNATNSRFNHPMYLTPIMPQGGLGNFMFVTASVWGLAQTNQRTMSFKKQYWAEKHFMNLGIPHVNSSELTGFTNDTEADAVLQANATLHEHHALMYDDRMVAVSAEFGKQHVVIGGYLQSWRYFDQYRDDIQALLTFSETVYVQAQETLRVRLSDHVNLTGVTFDSTSELPVLVGIHVRRGDVLDPDQNRHGHQAASNEYLLRVSQKLQTKYKDVWFLVFSNDMEYCRKLFDGLDNFVFMTPLEAEASAAVDMAILSLMDSLILTVGTFGWWAAYLSDATDVHYFKDWPREGSTMKNSSKAEDFFLPSWKPFL